jgi:hypothetical protein
MLIIGAMARNREFALKTRIRSIDRKKSRNDAKVGHCHFERKEKSLLDPSISSAGPASDLSVRAVAGE